MNFIYVIHLMCWNYLIVLIDMITHSRNRNNSGDGNNKGGGRAFLLFLFLPCDQVDQGGQVVPAHQVDDIDDVHELDPVHQVDHEDEHTEDDGRKIGRNFGREVYKLSSVGKYTND